MRSLDREGAPQGVAAWRLFRIPKGLKCVERREAGRGAGVHGPQAEFTFRTYCRQPLVRPGKLLKMIVWRGGTRSDRASHRTLPTRQSGEATNCSGALGKMYLRSQERHRNREATVYLPALGGDGPRLDRTIRTYKCSQASSAEESLKCCAALLAVSTEA